MNQNIVKDFPKIGYLYHYPRIDHLTDNFRLDIHITSKPSKQHFDVFRVQIPVTTEAGLYRHLKVSHPWHFEQKANVCAGVVIMEDREGKKEEAFTFGGHLTIDHQDQQVFCVLVSSAPILEISGITPVHMRFVEEVEILLAKIQAEYTDHQAYEKRMAKVEPAALYLACLEALLNKFEDLDHKDETQFQLLVYLHSQMHRLETAGMIREPILHLDELFD